MFENYLNSIKKMNKYILTVENNLLTEKFHETILECLKQGIGQYRIAGRSIAFFMYFTHEYDLERLSDLLSGLFSAYKDNCFQLFKVKTYGFCGYDTKENLNWLKDFDNA